MFGFLFELFCFKSRHIEVFTPTASTDHQYGKSYEFTLPLIYFIFLLAVSSSCKAL